MTVSVGPNLSDALMRSPIMAGDGDIGGSGGGAGFDFMDQDPELALALRWVSLSGITKVSPVTFPTFEM